MISSDFVNETNDILPEIMIDYFPKTLHIVKCPTAQGSTQVIVQKDQIKRTSKWWMCTIMTINDTRKYSVMFTDLKVAEYVKICIFTY